MEQAIKKAIEGGWKPTFNSLPHLHTNRDWQHITSDVLFWQALGKSLGWKIDLYENGEFEWVHFWHRFIDHLAEGKTPDTFFEELLK